MTRHSVSGDSPARAQRQIFQAQITPDAMLQMHHQIAFLQIREINVQRRTRRLGVRRFQPARPLDFVTPENFRIRHHHQLGRLAQEIRAPANRGEMFRLVPAWQAQFLPDFLETAGVRRRCCKTHGRHDPAAASDEVAGKIRGAAPRQFAVPAPARPADETHRAN